MKTNQNLQNSIMGIVLIVVFSLGLILTSCSIDPNINNSPNAINQDAVTSRDGVLGLSISMQSGMGDFYSGDRSRISAIWTWQMCAIPSGRPQPVQWNSYYLPPDGPSNDMWNLGYKVLHICNDVINFTPKVSDFSADEKKILVGMGNAYKAEILGELAAYFGSIPVTIVGLDPPKYVSQTVAYDTVQALLDVALNNFNGIAGAKGLDHDLNFSGDKANWIAVVHSLKARYFLHMSKYTQALAEANQGIQFATAPDAAHNLAAFFSTKEGEYSPWGHWTNDESGEPLRCEATFMRELKSETGDLRIPIYFTPNGAGQNWGVAVHTQDKANADTNELKPANSSHMNTNTYGSYGFSFPLMTDYETQLIIAECKLNGGDQAGALAALGSIRTWAGLAGNGGSDVLKEIIKQKQLTLFLEGQTYTDMRRLKMLPESAVPLRFPYGTSETSSNPNTPANSDQLVIWTR